MGRVTVAYKDYSGKITQVSFDNGVAVNAGNFAAQLALAEALADELDDLVMGTRTLFSFEAVRTDTSDAAAPATPVAQKNIRWYIVGRDSTAGRNYRDSVGTAFLALATVTDSQGNEYVDPTATAYTDFETAYNAFAPLSPEGGAMTLQQVIHVE